MEMGMMGMTLRRLALGKKGEMAAVKHLKRCGYRIIKTNYRCKIGELDIIAQDGDTLVFIEVRTRSSRRYGLAKESVGPVKQKKVRMVASFYIQSLGRPMPKVRFDVVAIYCTPEGRVKSFEHLENAF